MHEPRAEEDEEDGEGHPGKVLQGKVVSQMTVKRKKRKSSKMFRLKHGRVGETHW